LDVDTVKDALLETKVRKVGRNDPCPCGSGLKYKKCCLNKDQPNFHRLKEKYLRDYKIRLKGKEDIEAIKKAGRLALDEPEEGVRVQKRPHDR